MIDYKEYEVYGDLADDMILVDKLEAEIEDYFKCSGYTEDDRFDKEAVKEMNEYRLGVYKANGWDYDPYPVEYEEREDDDDMIPMWQFMSTSSYYRAIGLRPWDF